VRLPPCEQHSISRQVMDTVHVHNVLSVICSPVVITTPTRSHIMLSRYALNRLTIGVITTRGTVVCSCNCGQRQSMHTVRPYVCNPTSRSVGRIWLPPSCTCTRPRR
jgi:hypothetical protein